MIWARAVTDYYLPIAQEIPFIISDGTSPHISWLQSVNRLMARLPILSGQIPEKPCPLAYSLCNGNGNVNNQAGAVPNCRTHAGYNQVGNSWSHCTPNSPDIGTQSTSQYQKNRNSLVISLQSGVLTCLPQEAMFNYVSLIMQTQFQAMCFLVKCHSNTGKVLT